MKLLCIVLLVLGGAGVYAEHDYTRGVNQRQVRAQSQEVWKVKYEACEASNRENLAHPNLFSDWNFQDCNQ